MKFNGVNLQYVIPILFTDCQEATSAGAARLFLPTNPSCPINPGIILPQQLHSHNTESSVLQFSWREPSAIQNTLPPPENEASQYCMEWLAGKGATFTYASDITTGLRTETVTKTPGTAGTERRMECQCCRMPLNYLRRDLHRGLEWVPVLSDLPTR